MNVINFDRCVYCNVTRAKAPHLKYHRFPKDEERSKKWVLACKLESLLSVPASDRYKNYRVCSLHFRDADYASAKRVKLRSIACPSQFESSEYSISLPDMQETLKKKLTNGSATGVDETADFSSAVLQSTDAENLQVLTSTPKQRHNLLESSPDLSIIRCEEAEPTLQRKVLPQKRKYNSVERGLSLTPKRRKILFLNGRVRYLYKKIQRLTKGGCKASILHQLRPLLQPVIFNFIKSQILQANVAKKGRRYSLQDKNLALQLYLASPKAYDIVGQYFCLPHPKTLRRSLALIDIEPGFIPTVINSLKLVVAKLKPLDKLCIISMDEMKIKPALSYHVKSDSIIGYENYGSESSSKMATHALVFMVRGLCKKWKQVIGCFFSADTTPAENLQKLVCEAVNIVTECGLEPISMVCDLGSNNQKLFREMDVTPDHPYFFVGDKKIYAICDVPHLLKCLRNNFKNYDVTFEGHKTASWQHIVKLFELDSTLIHRAVKKLTSKHVYVSGLCKMNVRLAAQVFSHSVGAQLCLLTAVQFLPSAASHTADFCIKINSLFDSLNSRVKQDKNPLLSAAKASSGHLEEWRSSLSFIKSLKFQTNGKTIQFPSLRGWQITLSSLLLLVPELLSKVPFILLSRFNQDALENYFSQVRRRGGSNDHPTPLEFLQRTRMILAEKIFQICGTANCEPDEDVILHPTQIIPEVDEPPLVIDESVTIDESATIQDSEGGRGDWNDVERNSAAYVAGYILKKCLLNLNCDLCRSNLCSNEANPSNLLISFKEYGENKNALQYPSDELTSCILSLSVIFDKIFSTTSHQPGIMARLRTNMREAENSFLKCHEHVPELWELIISTYSKVMLFNRLKSISRSMPNVKKSLKKKQKL